MRPSRSRLANASRLSRWTNASRVRQMSRFTCGNCRSARRTGEFVRRAVLARIVLRGGSYDRGWALFCSNVGAGEASRRIRQGSRARAHRPPGRKLRQVLGDLLLERLRRVGTDQGVDVPAVLEE